MIKKVKMSHEAFRHDTVDMPVNADSWEFTIWPSCGPHYESILPVRVSLCACSTQAPDWKTKKNVDKPKLVWTFPVTGVPIFSSKGHLLDVETSSFA